MNETDLCFTPATELADAVEARSCRMSKSLPQVLNRIARLEPKLNAFAYVAAKEAMEAARRLTMPLPKASPSVRCTACR